jgi:hypothetical protein
MKKNLGTVDKIIRVLLAVIIGILYFTGVVTSTLGVILMVLSIIFLLTSLVSICPIYLALGLSTAKKK